jgi:hypothetical protein
VQQEQAGTGFCCLLKGKGHQPIKIAQVGGDENPFRANPWIRGIRGIPGEAGAIV